MPETVTHPATGSTQTDRWTLHAYPRRMWPDMERPISVVFFDDIMFPDTVPASLDLSAAEARRLIAALERALTVTS